MSLNQDILSIAFDTAASEKSKNILIAQLREVIGLANKINGIKIDIGSNATGLKAAIDNQAKLKSATDDYNKTLAENTKQQILNERLRQQQLKTLKAEEEQIKRNAAAQTAASKAAAANKPVPFTSNLNPNGTLKQPNSPAPAASPTAPVSTGTYTNLNNQTTALKALSSQVKLTAQSQAQLNQANQLAILDNAKHKLAVQQAAAALKIQAREEINVKGSLEQRRAALIRLTSTYDKLGANERSSGYGERLKTVIKGVSDQVKNLESETGRSQRRVGDYTGGIVAAFGKAFNGLRVLANILPGLGISGILLAAYEGAKALFSAFSTGSKTINDVANNFKNMNEVVAEANKSAGKEIADLKILYGTATDVNNSLKDRKLAVKELKKEFPEYFKNISDETILNGGAKKSYDELYESIIRTSRATAAKAKIDSLEAQRLDIEFQKQKIINATEAEKARAKDTEFKRLSSVQNDLADPNNTLKLSKKQNQLIIEERKKAALKDQDDKDASLKRQVDFLVKFAGGEKAIAKAIEDSSKDKQAPKVKTIAQAIAELRNELKAIQSEQDQGIISLTDADIKRVEKYRGTIEEIFKLKASDKDKNEASFKLGVEVNPIALRVIERQIGQLIEGVKKNDELTTVPIKIKVEPIDETKAYDEALAAGEKFNAIDLANSLATNAKKYSDGKISRTEYEKSILNIQKEYSLKGLDFLIRELESEKTFGLATIIDKKERAAKELDIDTKLAKARADKAKISADEILQIDKDLFAKKQEIANAAFDLGATILTSRFEKERNQIQELIDLNDEYYGREIENIQRSAIAERDKADQIAVLQATQAEKKNALDRRSRELQFKQAKFERDANALSIAGNAIAAHFTLVKQLGSAGFPLAIANDILAAIQIASLYARPLPRYAEGLQNNPKDHYGIYGEDGPELVQMPGRKPFIADQATIGFIPRGTNITPLNSDEVNTILYQAMAKQTAQSITGSRTSEDPSLELLMNIDRGISRMNQRKTNLRVSIQHSTEWQAYKNSIYKRG